MKKTSNVADTTLQVVLNRLRDPTQTVRCFDSETSGLSWQQNAIVGYVLAFSPDPRDSYYVPFRHAGKANVGGREGLKSATGWDGKLLPGEAELIKAIDQPGTLLFGHNMHFDVKFLSRVGFKIQPRIEDTMINAPLIDELVGKYSLDQCCLRHGVQAKKGQLIYDHIHRLFPEVKADKSSMGHFWRLSGDDPVAVEYACGDGTSTWQLRDAQMELIRKPAIDVDGKTELESMERVWDVESRLIPALCRMMVRGIKIDEERLEWIIAKVNKDVDDLKNEFPSGFNTRSPNDVQAWMEKHGHRDWPNTAPSKTFPNGKPSFTSDYLEKHDAGKKIIKVRKLENLNNTFCLPLRDRHMWRGRVHTSFNQLRGDEFGTVTGRLSSNDPNLQQVPKHDYELGPLYRSAFVPDFGLWGERDYSQVEPRLMAYYTRAKVFLNDYRNNPEADSHTAVAKAANPNWDNLDKAGKKHYRDNFGKRINQTVITGGGANAICNKYKVPRSEVDGMLRTYHKTLPELKPFQQASARRFRQRGYLQSLLGRRMHLDDPNFDYRALNRLLQGGNADILKVKIVEVDEFLEGERIAGRNPGVELLLNCHDALSSQFDEGSRKVYDHCKVIMEDFASEHAAIKVDLPIVTDEGEGKTWGVATYGDEK